MAGSRTYAIALACASVCVTACGTANNNGETSNITAPADAPRLSAVEYKRHVNKICSTAAKRTPPFPGRSSEDKGLVTHANTVVPYLRTLLAVNTEALDGISGLKPPEAQEAAVNGFIDAGKSRLVDLQQALDSALAGDAPGFTTAFQNDQREDGPRYISAAKKLGLTACATGR